MKATPRSLALVALSALAACGVADAGSYEPVDVVSLASVIPPAMRTAAPQIVGVWENEGDTLLVATIGDDESPLIGMILKLRGRSQFFLSGHSRSAAGSHHLSLTMSADQFEAGDAPGLRTEGYLVLSATESNGSLEIARLDPGRIWEVVRADSLLHWYRCEEGCASDQRLQPVPVAILTDDSEALWRGLASLVADETAYTAHRSWSKTPLSWEETFERWDEEE